MEKDIAHELEIGRLKLLRRIVIYLYYDPSFLSCSNIHFQALQHEALHSNGRLLCTRICLS